MATIGIDLGTTNSLAACWKDGKCILVPNSLNEVFTPSIVSIDEQGDIVVGRIAKERLVSHPRKTAANFKQFMGSEKQFMMDGRPFRPEDLSSFVLRSIKQDAENFLGEAVTGAVISVPAYFNDAQRSATKVAGELAGLQVERIINEPSAAALACQHSKDKEGTFLVFDFGGGTLDISVVEMFDNIVDITAVAGNNHLGGGDIDIAIVKAFLAKNPLLESEIDEQGMASLYKLAEQCKMALTEMKKTFMVFQLGEQTFSMEISNESLLTICAPLLEKIRGVLQVALREASLPISSVDDVIMVGGSCHMPLVQQFIKHLTGKKPIQEVDPDKAIAFGAGLLAGIKERRDDIKDMVMTDICPFSMGLSLGDKKPFRFSPIITRNSALPVSRMESYATVEDGQLHVSIEVYQGENMLVEQNLYIGKLELEVPPLPAGKAHIMVRFTYDINGILEVEAYCPQNNKSASTVLVSNHNLSKEEIAQRVTELQAYKISSWENDEFRLVVARMERVYAEHTGEVRQAAQILLERYMALVEKNESPAKIAKMKNTIDAFIERAEAFDDGLLEIDFTLSDEEWENE